MAGLAEFNEVLDGVLKATTLSSTLDEFCQRSLHNLLAPCGALGMFVATVEQDDKMYVRGSFGVGITPGEIKAVSSWRSSGIHEAITQRSEVHKSNVDPAWFFGENFEDSVELKGDGLIVPFTRYGLVIGGIGVLTTFDSMVALEDWIELDIVAWAAELVCSRYSQVVPTKTFSKASRPAISQVSLSTREIEVLQLAAKGLTNFQIGKQLHLSESSIKQEFGRIFRKLNVNSRAEALTELAKQSLKAS